jgi:hypothetical protein
MRDPILYEILSLSCAMTLRKRSESDDLLEVFAHNRCVSRTFPYITCIC